MEGRREPERSRVTSQSTIKLRRPFVCLYVWDGSNLNKICPMHGPEGWAHWGQSPN